MRRLKPTPAPRRRLKTTQTHLLTYHNYANRYRCRVSFHLRLAAVSAIEIESSSRTNFSSGSKSRRDGVCAFGCRFSNRAGVSAANDFSNRCSSKTTIYYNSASDCCRARASGRAAAEAHPPVAAAAEALRRRGAAAAAEALQPRAAMAAEARPRFGARQPPRMDARSDPNLDA